MGRLRKREKFILPSRQTGASMDTQDGRNCRVAREADSYRLLRALEDGAQPPRNRACLARPQGFRKHNDFPGTSKLFKDAYRRFTLLQRVDYSVSADCGRSRI